MHVKNGPISDDLDVSLDDSLVCLAHFAFVSKNAIRDLRELHRIDKKEGGMLALHSFAFLKTIFKNLSVRIRTATLSDGVALGTANIYELP